MTEDYRPAPHDLAGIRAKLWRADALLKELHDAIEAWRERGPYRLLRETKREGEGREVWIISLERVEPIPTEWSLLIGELLYNLHSALDHLAYQLAAKRSYPLPPERVTFPIYKNRGEFWKRGPDGRTPRPGSGGWRLQRISSDARLMLLEVQPYKRGGQSPDHPLWLLHTLSNHDKHQALHVVAAASISKRHEILNAEDTEITAFDGDYKPLDDRTEVGRLHLSQRPGVEPHSEGQIKVAFRVEPAFADAGPAAARIVIDTLAAIVVYIVEDVFVERFSPYLGI